MGKTIVRKKVAKENAEVITNALAEMNLEDSMFQKVDVEILKLAAGESFVGKLTDITDRPWLDRATGEVMTITQYHFIGPQNKAFVYFGDSGFKNLMYTTNVKKGDLIKVIKLDKKALEGTNRSVNEYELYKAAAH